MKVLCDSPSSSCNSHPFSPFFIFSNLAYFKLSKFGNFPFIIIFSSNHTIFELWGFFCPMKKLAMSWEHVATMQKESVVLRAQVAATIGVRAKGIVGTTTVGPIATTIADHHPPRVATTSRRVIRRNLPSSHQYVQFFVFV
jgi:hypothetical protein